MTTKDSPRNPSSKSNDVSAEIQSQFESKPLRADERLPRLFCDPDGERVLRTYGIEFGEPIDDRFVAVRLPAGWSKVAGDEGESHLIDDKGRKRARLAQNEKIAHVSLINRFQIDRFTTVDASGNPTDVEKPTHGAVEITDCEKVIMRLGVYLGRDRARRSELVVAAREWLNRNYPGWEHPSAYWD